jgi:hypothetical protein
MRTLTILIVFLALNTGALANGSTTSVSVDTVINYPQKHSIPLDTVISRFNKLAEVSGKCFVLVIDGMQSEGIVGYFRGHLDVFAPFITFLLLYGIWLRRRQRR